VTFRAELPEGADQIGDDWLDEEPEPGDVAADTRDGRLMYVLNEHPLPAGDVVSEGRVLADHMEVDESRRVVWVALLVDTWVSPREFETQDDLLSAVNEGAIVPTPFPVSLVAPVPDSFELTSSGE